MRTRTVTNRNIVCALGAVVALSASGAAWGAGAPRHPLCAQHKGKTLAKSATLRVFLKTKTVHTGGADVYYHAFYGCRQGSRKLHKLYTGYESADLLNGHAGVKVAGKRFAAIDEIQRDYAGDDEHDFDNVVVFDVTTGKRLGHIKVLAVDESLEAFGLTPKGGVAVLAKGETTSRVIADDAGGRRTLATAASVSGFSVAGATVKWTQDGQPKTATLSGAAK